MKISELNNANKITINSFLFCIVIDKKKHTIVQTRQMDKKVYIDKTDKCEKDENEYNIENKIQVASLSLGTICSKVLNNRVDDRCMKWLNEFDVMIET